jgi:hypothetical protein
MRHNRIPFGRFLRSKRNFLIFSLIGFGTPCAALFIWNFGAIGGVGFRVFLAVVAYAAGLLWGVLMWEFFVKNFDDNFRGPSGG